MRQENDSVGATDADDLLNIAEWTVVEADGTLRLDVFLAQNAPDLTRTQAKRLIEEGNVLLNDRPASPSARLRPGDRVRLTLPPPEPSEILPEAIPLSVVYEDSDLIVIDKPAGMVVHPGIGVRSGTLVNALLHHCPDLSGIGGVERPGIVHRLDRDTSGLLVVAKHDRAHQALLRQFQTHHSRRIYAALVVGNPPERGRVDAPIGRHSRDPQKRSIGGLNPRDAVTHFQVVERFGTTFALLDVRLETGRTHQIRVHLTHIGFPILGDSVYGNALERSVALTPDALHSSLSSITRQLLHARSLGFTHPSVGKWMEFSAPLPEDFARVLDALRNR